MAQPHSKTPKSFLIITFIYILFNVILFASIANIVFIYSFAILLVLAWMINIVLTIFILIGLFYFKRSKCIEEETKKKLIKYNILAFVLTNIYIIIGVSLGNSLLFFAGLFNEEFNNVFKPHLIFDIIAGLIVISVISLIIVIAVTILFILEMRLIKKKSIDIENEDELIKEKKETKTLSIKLFMFYIIDYISIILLNCDTSFVVSWLIGSKNNGFSSLTMTFFTIIPDLFVLLLFIIKFVVLIKNKELFKPKEFLFTIIPFVILVLIKGLLNFSSFEMGSNIFTCSLFLYGYSFSLVSMNELIWPFLSITYGVFLSYRLFKIANKF